MDTIQNILDKYLVIDSDTFFLKPTTFIENNKCLYNYGSEYNKSYFYGKRDSVRKSKGSIRGSIHATYKRDVR